MKKTIASLSILAILLLTLPATNVLASGSSSKWAAELVWGNNMEWQMLAPPGHGSAKPAEPLYIVAPQTSTPQSPTNNDHLPGVAHDHVVSVPPHNSGEYNANWRVFVALCTPTAISAGTCTPDWETFPGPGGPGTGPTLPLAQAVNGGSLTSDAAIDAAVNGGQIALVDAGITFICLIVPLH